ncbi:MAG: pyridoxal phosphate-dependent aminotransferase [Devosia sp.]|jgi:aminotransferase|uniref:pyridoxal phosphate-dependent aminotransferase n=1 Tax=unclassified Devosia TaxID=196773 RepID=UPI001A0EA38B|nr:MULTISPECIES: pyridoxal phosphate-dependent aminotransferase [unclassified Devosia]MBF0678627.1 pyridoxal phosphate-dependent aminotransferase [Devosia sp.]WEJ31802.1 pyridoxal phosphate-dependent aminotransferase [Devosia sp. SD17-2]
MSAIASKLTNRIVEEDLSFRSRMMEIAAGMNNVIAMGRGDPDFHTPKHIAEAAKKAIDENQHHYTGPTGIPALRQAIAEHLTDVYNLDHTADEIIVTAGVQESITLLMLALINPGDEVLITSPRFMTYDTAVNFAGGVPVPVPTFQKDDFALDINEIEKRITPKTRMFVLVSPNNPTGAVTPPAVIRQIAELAIKHDIIIVSDEIYAQIIYDGNEHLSIGTLPGMKERTITLNGFSKTFAMTGWRVGYLAAPADFVTKVTEMRHTLSINTCTVSQYAALAALTGPMEPIQAMIDAYTERRAFLLPALDEMGLTYGNPGGAFYVYINVSGTGMSTPDFCEKLLRETGVMMFPGTMFGDHDPSYIRLSFLQPLEVIKDAVERMKGFMARHGKAA